MSYPNDYAASAPAEDDVIDLGALLSTLWRKKWWIVVASALSLLVGAYYAYAVAVPKYRATSVILLDPASQQVVDLSAVLPSLGTDSEAINTEVEVLKSRKLLERVVAAADLISDPEFNESLQPPSLKSRVKAAVETAIFGAEDMATLSEEEQINSSINALLKRMSVRNVPNTYVLQVTMQTEGAQKSAHLANTLAQQYVLYQLDVKFEATREASEWLTSRVADLKIELETAEAKVADFSANSTAISPESVQALDRQIKDLRDRYDASLVAADSAASALAVFEDLNGKSDEEKVVALKDSRLSAALRIEGDSTIFDARFEQLRDRARAQAERTAQQVSSLEESIALREAEIATQSEEIIQLQQFAREAEASRLLYEYFLGRLKETAAQEGIQQADSRILSDAVIPSSPSEPRKPLVMAMSLILGAMISAAAVILWESRQNGFRNGEDLEDDTGLRLLGQIPLLPVTERKAGLEYLAAKPTSAAAEAVRNLRTSMLLADPDKAPKVIMSTSSLPGEGKTTVSFALAQNLVGLGKSVLLVEGDIRRRVFDQYLEVKGAKGLMSILSGDKSLKEVVRFDKTLGADVLLSENSSQNAADIFSSQSFQSFLDAARDAYDFIIIDTPPVLVVPDARIIAQHADVVLFTVRWDFTSKTQVRTAIRMLDTVGVKVSGLVLNQIDPKGMKRYGYGEQYGAYGAYGANYYNN